MDRMPFLFKVVAAVAVGVACAIALVFSAAAILAFGRPPQPLKLGTMQWVGEGGFTVDSVERVRRVTSACSSGSSGSHTASICGMTEAD